MIRDISAKLPDEKADMVPVQEDTGFALVVEEGAEVYSTDYMPAAFELFFKALLDVLSCIFEIGYLVLYHLHIDVFGY